MKNIDLFAAAYERSSSVSPYPAETQKYVLHKFGLSPAGSGAGTVLLVDQLYTLMKKSRKAGYDFVRFSPDAYKDPVNDIIPRDSKKENLPWDEAYLILSDAVKASDELSKRFSATGHDYINTIASTTGAWASPFDKSTHTREQLFKMVEEVFLYDCPGSTSSKSLKDPVDLIIGKAYGSDRFHVEPEFTREQWNALLNNVLGDTFKYSSTILPDIIDDQVAISQGLEPPSSILESELTSKVMDLTSLKINKLIPGTEEYKKTVIEITRLQDVRKTLNQRLKELKGDALFNTHLPGKNETEKEKTIKSPAGVHNLVEIKTEGTVPVNVKKEAVSETSSLLHDLVKTIFEKGSSNTLIKLGKVLKELRLNNK